MFTELLEPVPTVWKVPILVLFFVMILLAFFLLAGYSFRTPLFEIGPGRLTGLNSDILEIKQMLLKREGMPALRGPGYSDTRLPPLATTTSRPALERFFSTVEEVDGAPASSHDAAQEEKARPRQLNSAVEEVKPTGSGCGVKKAGGGVKAVVKEPVCMLTPVKAGVVVAPDVGTAAVRPVNLSTTLTSPTTGALDLRKDVIMSTVMDSTAPRAVIGDREGQESGADEADALDATDTSSEVSNTSSSQGLLDSPPSVLSPRSKAFISHVEQILSPKKSE